MQTNNNKTIEVKKPFTEKEILYKNHRISYNNPIKKSFFFFFLIVDILIWKILTKQKNEAITQTTIANKLLLEANTHNRMTMELRGVLLLFLMVISRTDSRNLVL